MMYSHFDQYASDENRAVEGIAALIDLTPRLPSETDEALAQRMADWGKLQGPEIRQGAILYAARKMITSKHEGMGFTLLASIGLEALKEYNTQSGAA